MGPAEFAAFRQKLIRWYGKSARDLPWRRTRDAYQIWISEIMLQQTTVAAVVPYFERFLKSFPTVFELAAAEENAVLRHWEGLGYYSRARNIHKTAKIIVDQYQGQFPDDLEALLSLPGIGRYTAGAIASFAFDQPAPIVEANTLRLYCRLLGYDKDPRSKEGQAELWAFATAILPRKSPGQINQALMELGASHCGPAAPECDACPVHQHCRACREGTQATIPLPKAKIELTDVTEVSIAVRDRNRYLLRKRTTDERWAGLWDFVRFEIPHGTRSIDIPNILNSISERTGLTVELGPQVAEWKHGVTRYRITLKCFTADRLDGRLASEQEWKWVKPNEFSEFPLSVTARKFAKKLQKPANELPNLFS